MHVNRGLLGWGVFFIIFGAVPLAVRAGAIDESVVLRAWELWPLILIGIGLGLVLQRTKAAFVGGLIVAVTAGLMAGGLLAAGISGISGFGTGWTACGVGGGDRTPFPEQRASFGADARYVVELDCGALSIDTVSGSDWTLTGTSPDGRAPVVTVRPDGLEVRPQERGGTTIGFGTTAGVDWNMSLPSAPRTRLDLQVNAGSADAELGGLSLSQLDLQLNAGSMSIDLGEAAAVDRVQADVNAGSLSIALPAADVRGDLAVNAGSIEVCVPAGVDLRIRVADNTLSSTDFGDSGLVQQGDTWETPGFGAEGETVELTVSANLGSIDLNPENGCAQ